MTSDIDKQSYLIEYQNSFVRSRQNETSTSSRTTVKESPKYNLTGDEVKEFYETLISDSAFTNEQMDNFNKTVHEQNQDSVHMPKTRHRTKDEPFSYRSWVNSLLKFSAIGDYKKLKDLLDGARHRSTYKELINSIDTYGWTALMCAAAEGHLQIVQYLISEGCLYKDMYDISGRDLYVICQNKQRKDILDYLQSLEVPPEKPRSKVRKQKRKITCDICNQEYFEKFHKQHAASTTHIFNDSSKKTSNVLGIPGNNIGYQMLLRSGWSSESGLGPDGSGRKNPVKTVLKRDRHGLGLVEKPAKRINHFNAYDVSAIKKVKIDNASSSERKQKKLTSRKLNESKKLNERLWERDLRHHMSTDF